MVEYWRTRQMQLFPYKAAMLKHTENLSDVSHHLFPPPILSHGATPETSLVPLPGDSRLFRCIPWFWIFAELPIGRCKEWGRTWAAEWKRIRYRSLGHNRHNSLDHQNLLHDKRVNALRYPEQTRRSAALSLKLSHGHYFQKTEGNRLLRSES